MKTGAFDSIRPASVDEAVEKIREEFRGVADLDDLGAVQRLAGIAAEAMLAVGDVPRAAHFCRAAGMVEEAHRLYTELLGAPEEGVEVELAHGNPEGAANLLESAGRAREAAAALSVAARRSPRPSRFVERVFRLDPEEGLRLLDDLLCARVPDEHNAPLFYRLGVELQAVGQGQRAGTIFKSLFDAVGPYADLAQRIEATKNAPPTVELPGSIKRTPVTEELKVLPPLSPKEAVGVVREAVRVAAQRVRGSLAPGAGVPRAPSGTARRVDAEPRSSLPPLLDDDAVRLARSGLTVATLQGFLRGASCDLSNIEVYYRIGLAQLAAGDWDEAQRAFDAVEATSPGYRDAGRRAEAVRVWRSAVASKTAGPRDGIEGLVQGRYVLRGELGRGGMGVVYRAEDRLLAREVALKFTSARSRDGAVEEVFLAEARASAGLNHPNVVTVYDLGTHDGRVFIAMELVEGTDLARYLAQHGPPPVLEALRAIVAAMEGVDFAHNRGVIHRDIKLSNLLRTAVGGVKVSDFGIAAGLSKSADERIFGTPEYMAPELLAGEVADRRADVFSLGVTLFELLTGVVPFDGARRDEPAIRVGHLRSGIPQLVEGAIANALQLDPELRYQTVGEFLAPLRHVLDGVDGLSEQLLRNGATAFEVVPTLPPLAAMRGPQGHST